MQQRIFGRVVQGPLEGVGGLLQEARQRQQRLARVPSGRVRRRLGSCGARWADAEDPLRRRALAELPALLGMSREMVGLSLDLMAEALDESNLLRKIHSELGPEELLDGYFRRQGVLEGYPSAAAPHGDLAWRACPRGVVLAVAPGNVFVGAAMTVAECLLAGNLTLLKAPSSDPVFGRWFAQSLGELEEFVAVLAFKGGTRELEAALVGGVDAVVVSGGEESVRRYRSLAPAGVEVIAYGPRLSLAAVSREAACWQSPQGVEELCRRLARDVSLWDQQACSAPQLLYVEGREQAERLLEPLARELERLARELPPGAADVASAVEITKERELRRFEQSQGRGRLLASPRGQAWTLLYEPENPAPEPSPLFRTLRVKVVEALEELDGLLRPLQGVLQTAGLEAGPARTLELARRWSGPGLTRVCPPGEMAGGSAGEPHDGALGLQPLVRWSTLRLAPGTPEPVELEAGWQGLGSPADPDEDSGSGLLGAEASLRGGHPTRPARPAADPTPLALEAALNLVAFARRAPHYRELFEGMTCESLEDFRRLPLTDRDALRDLDRILTGPVRTGVVLRSGGTTGAPRYCLMSREDYQADIRAGVTMFRAMGVERGDRCADLFLSGDLYGSFLSIHQVLDGCGAVNFPFTASASTEAVRRHLEAFSVNLVTGVSSQLVRFFHELEELGYRGTVPKVIYGGEALPAADRERIRARFGTRWIRSVLGANDGGPIGYQCPHCTGAVHHGACWHVLLEVLDPETLCSLPVGEPGELVITCLARRLMPLIRYRVGDRGRLLPGGCPCGRATPRFELLGRVDDLLCIASTNTSWSDVSGALEGLCGLSGALQLVGEGEVLRVRVERSQAAGDPGETPPGEVRARLLERLPLLSRRLEEGLLQALEVDLVPPGTLERNPRTGKLIRVVDRRLAGR